MWKLYLHEQELEGQRIKALAAGVGAEVARILAPLWGGEVRERGDDSIIGPEAEEYLSRTSDLAGDEGPAVYNDGEKRWASWRTVEIDVRGETRRVPAPPEGWAYNADGRLIESNPSEGYPINDTGLETKASPRII